jgi:hypothetical protein
MRYIHASEIGSFLYCRKQWELAGKKRQVTPHYDLPTTDPKLLGIRAHARHAERVRAALAQTGTLGWILIIAALGFVALYAGTIVGPML